MTDLPTLTQDQLKRLAAKGSMVQAWMVKSMATELIVRRDWDAPESQFPVTDAERAIIEAIRRIGSE